MPDVVMLMSGMGSSENGKHAPAIEVRQLTKNFDEVQAVRGVDFEVATGGITTILGANGAGKTTTLRAVCNMVRSSGEVVPLIARGVLNTNGCGMLPVTDAASLFVNVETAAPTANPRRRTRTITSPSTNTPGGML